MLTIPTFAVPVGWPVKLPVKKLSESDMSVPRSEMPVIVLPKWVFAGAVALMPWCVWVTMRVATLPADNPPQLYQTLMREKLSDIKERLDKIDARLDHIANGKAPTTATP